MMFVFNQYRDVYGNLVYVLSQRVREKLESILNKLPNFVNKVEGTLITVLTAIGNLIGKVIYYEVPNETYSCSRSFALNRVKRVKNEDIYLTDIEIIYKMKENVKNFLKDRSSEDPLRNTIDNRAYILQKYFQIASYLIYIRLNEGEDINGNSYKEFKGALSEFFNAVKNYFSVLEKPNDASIYFLSLSTVVGRFPGNKEKRRGMVSLIEKFM